MKKEDSYFFRIQEWYLNQSRDYKKSKFGIKIDTIDNPGWSIWINLKNTSLEHEKFEEVRVEVTDDNWILCWLKDNIFEGGGGPLNLTDLIYVFLTWANKNTVSFLNISANKDIMINALENWYKSQCNGDWEHEFGITIETTDDPSWLLKIDLVDTPLEEKIFKRFKYSISENDWVDCWVSEKKFQAKGGIKNLNELIKIFCEWINCE